MGESLSSFFYFKKHKGKIENGVSCTTCVKMLDKLKD
jgi:hypothetical protein